MSDAVLDSIADALSEIESTLTKQVDTVSALVREAELAEKLVSSSQEQIRLARATLARTRQLKRSVGQQRDILATLRATLREVCSTPDSH
jgi:hypothetical protein